MVGYRLSEGGSHIDRTATVQFSFDGRVLSGSPGDTLASALLANGETLVARSFKYHRPRGIYSAGHEEPSGLVTLRSDGRQEPNAKATVTEICEGLEARSQNAWPSLKFEAMAVNQMASSIFVAGFYYKTFMGTGQRFWHFCETFIRRSAGMGTAGKEADPDRYERANLFADVLVIGGGAAGIAAARAAAKKGADVLLVDENSEIGGALHEDIGQVDGMAAAVWGAQALVDLPNVRILSRTSVYGYFDANVLGAVERVADHVAVPDASTPRQRHLKIYADDVIIATGSIERPLVFGGNDLPGVMMAQSGLRYATRYGVAVGREVVLTGNNDTVIDNALKLQSLGVNIGAVVDMRGQVDPADLTKINASGIRYFQEHAVVRACGGRAIKRIEIAQFDSTAGETSGSATRLKCDALLVSGAFTPMVNLCSQAGSPPVYDAALDSFVPAQALLKWSSAGGVN